MKLAAAFSIFLLISFFASTKLFSQIITEKKNTMDSSNQQVISNFYTCFQNKNYQGMQDCYADNATFSDPVFINLNASQVKKMWEMLCVRGKDLKLDFKNIQTSGNHGSAMWIAYYTFSATGRKVVNHVTASFIIENGKIVKHTDVFSFYKWSRQAFGITGSLIGWTPFFKKKLRQGAMKSLNEFSKKK